MARLNPNQAAASKALADGHHAPASELATTNAPSIDEENDEPQSQQVEEDSPLVDENVVSTNNDESDEDLDEQQLANVVNSNSLKRVEPQTTYVTNFISGVKAIFTASPKRKKQDESNTARKRTKVSEEVMTGNPTALGPATSSSKSTKLVRPKSIYADISRPKSGQQGRPDTYEVPDDIPVTSRVTRSQKNSGEAQRPHEPQVVKSSAKSSKRQRGMPRKAFAGETGEMGSALRSGGAKHVENDDSRPPSPPEHCIRRTEEGVDSVLIHPTPAKGIQSTGRERSESPHHIPAQDSDHFDEVSDGAEHEKRIPFAQPTENEPSGHTGASFDIMSIKERVQTMKLLMDSVGHATTMKKEKSRQEALKRALQEPNALKAEGLKSRNGKAISRTSDKILTLFDGFHEVQEAEISQNPSTEGRTMELKELIATMKRQSKSIQKATFGDPSNGGRNADSDARKQILQDLYIHVFPKMVNTIDAAVKYHGSKPVPSVPALEEILEVLEILSELLQKCLKQKKPARPVEGRYEFTRPSKELFPIVRAVIKEVKDGIAAQTAAEHDAEIRRRAPALALQRQKRLEEEKRAEEEEFRKKVKERNKAMATSLRHTQSRFGLNQKVIQVSDVRSSKSQQRPIQEHKIVEMIGDSGMDDDEWYDSYDPVDENEQLEERVHMFGGRNQKHAAKARPWTYNEMATLIDGLRLLYGEESCYQQIQARLVDRSLDEVFEKAREFRVAMEDEHALQRHQNPGVRVPPLERWILSIN